MDRSTPGRRAVLRTGAVTLAAAVGVAGCLGDGDDGGDGDGGPTATPTETATDTETTTQTTAAGGISVDDYPAVDEWLTETSVGGADDTYDGTIEDRRDADTVEVSVGASGNDGNFAYAPVAVAVRPGATVRWVWTGEGDPHNVEAEPDEQIGESDYEFSSGEPESGEGTEYSRSFDEEGLALYHCEPHLSLGMKGAVVVASA